MGWCLIYDSCSVFLVLADSLTSLTSPKLEEGRLVTCEARDLGTSLLLMFMLTDEAVAESRFLVVV